MAVALQKVKPGDPLAISATTFNTIIDAARDYQDRQRNAKRDAQREYRQVGLILVRNDSGADRDRFDVLAIDGPVITPSDQADSFKERVAVSGITPTDEHKGKFVVLFEPLRSGALGRAYVDGVCPVRVEMADEDDTFADVVDGEASKLRSDSSGAAALLWVEPPGDRQDPMVAWTLARLGAPAAAPAASGSFATITSRAGLAPPYRYSAVEATMDEDGGWSQVAGGEAYTNVFNLEEQGAGGQWVAAINVGDVVLIYAAPDPDVDAFVGIRAHYRGTF